MTTKYQFIGFAILIGFTGWIGYSMSQKSHTGPPMRITRIKRFDSGYKMNVEFPAVGHSKVTSVDGVDVCR